MTTQGDTELKNKIWEQAWSHSRHLESMRSQYLGFYFTAVLAVTAVTAKELAGGGLKTTGALIAFSALVLGLEALAAFLLMAIKRIGFVLGSYRKSVLAIKNSLPGGDESWADLPGPATNRLVSTQGAAEAVLYASLVVFCGALVAGAVRSGTVGGTTQIVCWLAAALALTVTASCLDHAIGFDSSDDPASNLESASACPQDSSA